MLGSDSFQTVGTQHIDIHAQFAFAPAGVLVTTDVENTIILSGML
jgi:hypothetical protein